jgi:hypothetical protein
MSKVVGRMCVAFFVFALSVTAAAAAGIDLKSIQSAGLTKDQAKEVLVLALKHDKYNLSKRGVFIDGDLKDANGNPAHPGYYDFSLGYDSPKSGATEYMGLFSVSVLTGDVWETNTCKRLGSRALKRLQTVISHKTTKTFADEKDARRGLGCTDE